MFAGLGEPVRMLIAEHGVGRVRRVRSHYRERLMMGDVIQSWWAVGGKRPGHAEGDVTEKE